jgi:iron complex transport system permease protein
MMAMNKSKIIFYNTILIIVLIFVFVLALIVGRYQIPLSTFFKILFGNKSDYLVETSIIVNLRLPRTVIALLVGSALSLAGLVYQETFQNKLVSPDFLGVSGGASVGAALAIILGLSSVWLSGFSFVFGIGAMLITIMIAKIIRNNSPTILILSGIIVSSFMSATLSLLKYMAEAETQLATITYWLMGSFEFSTMKEVYILAPIVVISSAILFSIRWRINIVAQGPEEAQTQGLNYVAYRYLIIVLATLITASSVAFSGVIGWVGLIIPHIIRLFVGKNTKYTIPLTLTFGSIFMIITDILSRSFTGSEIPLTAITGFLGAPIFIFILLKKRGTKIERI